MDPYQTLGLQRNASEEEAKMAFRSLAKTCHPDLHPNDPDAERRFKEINTAYDIICKGDKVETVKFRTGDFNFEDAFEYSPFGNIFKEIRRRNNDINLAVVLTLEEAFHGKEINIAVNNQSIKAQIPAGVAHGMRIQMRGGGNQPNPTLPPGDLYVEVRIRPHDTFYREQNNLITKVPVSVFDVLLKKTIEVINIEGKSLNVSLSGSRMLRLSGQGMPNAFNGTRGDLLIEPLIHYPENLTDEQQDLIAQAAEKEFQPTS